MAAPNPGDPVTRAAFAGALVTILAWILERFFSITIPVGVTSAFTVVLIYLVNKFDGGAGQK